MELKAGRVSAVVLPNGEKLSVDNVIINADTAALTSDKLGYELRYAVPTTSPNQRSLSAMTFAMVTRCQDFPLHRHTVFFNRDYASEFTDIFRHARMPSTPTVYVCAQDRGDNASGIGDGPERLFCLVNAPPVGDRRAFGRHEIDDCQQRILTLFEHCGLTLEITPESCQVTTPQDFEQLFPGTGGALYGPASHGWLASFRRSGAGSRIPGLYLAGGSTHPGAGVPMAALSGSHAARRLLMDCKAAH